MQKKKQQNRKRIKVNSTLDVTQSSTVMTEKMEIHFYVSINTTVYKLNSFMLYNDTLKIVQQMKNDDESTQTLALLRL